MFLISFFWIVVKQKKGTEMGKISTFLPVSSSYAKYIILIIQDNFSHT